MRFPLSWLKEYLPLDLSPEKIGELLTMVGLEVEKIDTDKYEGDAIIEIAITPNLGHAASLLGIAKEIAPLVEAPLHLPHPVFKEKERERTESWLKVIVEDKDLCPRYTARVIANVRVASSPEWLKKRIEQCGLRTVNNVVDITNYVLLEYGYPLHAFDYAKLKGHQIVVRRAKAGEKIITLDGQERYPTEEALLICDERAPAAVAGIMGGAATEVTESTKNIVLEAAYFTRESIRRTSKQLGLQTEASRRFERGIDPNGVLPALARACELLEKWAAGTPLFGEIDKKERQFLPKRISLRLSRVNQLLGTNLALGEVEGIFQKHDYKVDASNATLHVEVPTYRTDIQEEIDLVEEVARYYGYDLLSTKNPTLYQEGTLPSSPLYIFEKKVRECLVGEGLQEILTADLISEEQSATAALDLSKRSFLRVLNPSSIEHVILRPTLLPGMLEVVKKNIDHGITDLSLFEVGRVHFKVKEEIYEPSVASILLTGLSSPYFFDPKTLESDFFDLKGIVENLFEALKLSPLFISPSTYANFHPFRQAEVSQDGRLIGILGEIHPETLKNQGIKQRVLFAELNLSDLLQISPRIMRYRPLPRFPFSHRDLTLTLSEKIPVEQCYAVLNDWPEPLLEQALLLDVYRSEKLGSGRKNVTLRFIYRDREKTLSNETVDRVHQEISQHLERSMQAS